MAGSENKGTGAARPELGLASLSIHADDNIHVHRAVAPAMHVSTTFRYADNPDDLVPNENVDVCRAPSSSLHLFPPRESPPELTKPKPARGPEGLAHVLAHVEP